MKKEYNLPKEEQDMLKIAKIETSKGVIFVKMFSEDAPNTVANFASLANSEFYKDLSFHRVIKGFMAQGGCPDGTGAGGPGYEIKDEINKNKNLRGSIAMAHRGPNTAGSQFFICFVDCPHLDGDFSVFGRIEASDKESYKVLDSIEQNDKILNITVGEGLE